MPIGSSLTMSEIKFITPDWSVPASVKAIVSTRQGGVSAAPFNSLNIGLHVNDRESDVLINRKKIIKALNLPSNPIWLNQIHSSNVVELGDIKPDALINADGVYTQSNKVVCAVMTADCLPLFLSNKSGDKIAIIHVGWRGLAGGIIENAITLFDELPENIIAWAGPCISVRHFEIGSEVRLELKGTDSAYQNSENKGKYYANMYQLTGERLRQLGVINYGHSNYCTYADKELFFSHRRDQGSGRMVSLIWLDK